jgi:3'-phosphoadenosine 5'-phosphosulfate sulfotransferase (PAPS reductase)/FAD synthetase
MSNKVRHVLGLSGGKDSAALAVYLHKQIPNMEYFFCDTHKELQETYDFLDKLKARLGISITYLSAERGFDHWLDVYGGVLPSPNVRWCTKQLKIKPLEEFIGDDETYSYIAIRADENRDGYKATRPNIHPVFPFKEQGIVKKDVFRILEEAGIGVPKYYEWRTRSGCYFCFFQRKYEWVMLAEKHPDLFEKAIAYEEEHSDGRTFTWSQGESLRELVGRRDQIIADHEATLARQLKNAPNRPLIEVLEDSLDGESDEKPCVSCHY